MSWWREITPRQWRTLFAAQAGWMLDATDVMLYAFALNAIREEFAMSAAQAGLLASWPLLASAAGGASAGWLADRFGRVRVLIWSILMYSVFTALTATARSVGELVLWRTLVGIGMGAEWSAGSVLVAETWPAAHRGKAAGIMQSGWAIGYIVAAMLAAMLIPVAGWRGLFLAGALPALLTLWIRRGVPEPDLWRATAARSQGGAARALFAPAWRSRFVLATLTGVCLQFAYWGVFTWMPAFLASPASQGGAGLGLVRSVWWILPMQIGAFFGYTSFGFVGDRWGRKPAFYVFVAGAAVMVLLFGWIGSRGSSAAIFLLVIAPLVGYFGHGYFSVFGALLAELFPSSFRATAQGLSYNLGRGFAAAAPFAVGAVADRSGLGAAIASCAGGYVLAALFMTGLPETKGTDLA